jgi:hypothetical protein
MLKLISIVLTVFLLTKPGFSKETEKKIKFHPPETEAEKALDEILRIGNDIILNKQNTKEEIFTKDFLKEELWQAKYYEECNKGNVWCNKDDIKRFQNISHITGGYKKSNHDFLYLTSGDTKKLIFIDMYSILKPSTVYKARNNNDIYLDIFHFKYLTVHYVMKKEDGQWKIDGICSGALKINHPACSCPCIVDYNDINSFE